MIAPDRSNLTENGRIRWSALVSFGIGRLGLAPDAFWALTPRELRAAAGISAAPPMNRAAFDRLAAAFPDAAPAPPVSKTE